MDATEHTEALRAKLAAVDRERVARNELVSNNAWQSLTESRRRSEDLISNAGAVAARLNERATPARDTGGWETSGTGAQPDDEVNFGVTEPDTVSSWQPPEPRPTPPPRARRRPPGDADPEDDFARTKWWDG